MSNKEPIQDEQDMQGLIPVRVIKPFYEIRSPCPPAGTVGEIFRFDEEYAVVRFPLPMLDQDGGTWLTCGEDENYMRLKFLLDEIEVIE